MILQASTNKNMNCVIGLNFTQTAVGTDGKTGFHVVGSENIHFRSKIINSYVIDNMYRVITEHSTYEFELLPGEHVNCGVLMSNPSSALWEFEHSV